MMNKQTKEIEMYESRYGMFSAEGDEAVSRVIETAKNFNMTWDRVVDFIDSICRMRPNVREMLDTAVLEEIFDAIGYDESVDFYQ